MNEKERAVLASLLEPGFFGERRLPKTPERDALMKMGYIASNRKASWGRQTLEWVWEITAAGRAALASDPQAENET